MVALSRFILLRLIHCTIIHKNFPWNIASSGSMINLAKPFMTCVRLYLVISYSLTWFFFKFNVFHGRSIVQIYQRIYLFAIFEEFLLNLFIAYPFLANCIKFMKNRAWDDDDVANFVLSPSLWNIFICVMQKRCTIQQRKYEFMFVFSVRTKNIYYNLIFYLCED